MCSVQVGSFPNWDIWGEWNGKYRDDIRRFIKGDPGAFHWIWVALALNSSFYATHETDSASYPLLKKLDLCMCLVPDMSYTLPHRVWQDESIFNCCICSIELYLLVPVILARVLLHHYNVLFPNGIGMKKVIATRISGSADLYQKNNRKPYHSINFVVAHDGFTLRDLVSYNSKHNEANGENNQ